MSTAAPTQEMLAVLEALHQENYFEDFESNTDSRIQIRNIGELKIIYSMPSGSFVLREEGCGVLYMVTRQEDGFHLKENFGAEWEPVLTTVWRDRVMPASKRKRFYFTHIKGKDKRKVASAKRFARWKAGPTVHKVPCIRDNGLDFTHLVMHLGHAMWVNAPETHINHGY